MTNDLKIYKLIGEIHNTISLSTNSDEAIKKTLKLIVDSGNSNYAILWYFDKEKEVIHPYYWLCPMDLSSIAIVNKQGVIGKSFASKKSLLINNLEKEDPILYKSLNKFTISSMYLVPFSNENGTEGLISIIKENGSFLEDEKEIYDILILLVDTLVKEKFQSTSWSDKKKIMSISNLKKDFINGGITTNVLKGLNFDIFEGEFLCLLGESGCGKSTLLNIVGGLETASSGEIIYEGNDLTKANEKALTDYRRHNVGFIFQSYNLMPNLNAKENLDLIGELVKNPLDSKEALDLVGLSDKAKNYPSQLSGGQQQRISIARALIKNPKLILADEPTAALDYSTSIEVLQALENVIKTQKTTLVMVTHNEEISKMADRVIRFRNGLIYEISINNHKLEAKDLIW